MDPKKKTKGKLHQIDFLGASFSPSTVGDRFGSAGWSDAFFGAQGFNAAWRVLMPLTYLNKLSNL